MLRKDKKQASILSPVQESLDEMIWSGENLKPEVSEFCFGIVEGYLKNFMAEEEIPVHLRRVVLIGSITGYQYDNDADLDVNIFLDLDTLADNLGLEKELVIYEMRGKLKEVNGELYPGTSHPVNLFLSTEEGYPPADGIYDMMMDEWIKKPGHPGDIDPYANLKDAIDRAEEIAEKVDAKWGAAQRTKAEIDRYPQSKPQIIRQYIRYLKSLNRILENVVSERREIFDLAKKQDIDAPQTSVPNIIYKYLEIHGLLDHLHEAAETLERYSDTGSFSDLPSKGSESLPNSFRDESDGTVTPALDEALRMDSHASMEKNSEYTGKYKEGDRVRADDFFGTVSRVDDEDEETPYYVIWDDEDENWEAEENIDPLVENENVETPDTSIEYSSSLVDSKRMNKYILLMDGSMIVWVPLNSSGDPHHDTVIENELGGRFDSVMNMGVYESSTLSYLEENVPGIDANAPLIVFYDPADEMLEENIDNMLDAMSAGLGRTKQAYDFVNKTFYIRNTYGEWTLDGGIRDDDDDFMEKSSAEQTETTVDPFIILVSPEGEITWGTRQEDGNHEKLIANVILEETGETVQNLQMDAYEGNKETKTYLANFEAYARGEFKYSIGPQGEHEPVGFLFAFYVEQAKATVPVFSQLPSETSFDWEIDDDSGSGTVQNFLATLGA